MKRILKNLAEQDKKYMYCPSCKEYDEVDYDPVENIEKFMEFIRKEQHKINPPVATDLRKAKRDLPDDSVSEITDLDQEDILNKYYREKMSKIAQQKRERAQAKRRLDGGGNLQRHIC